MPPTDPIIAVSWVQGADDYDPGGPQTLAEWEEQQRKTRSEVIRQAQALQTEYEERRRQWRLTHPPVSKEILAMSEPQPVQPDPRPPIPTGGYHTIIGDEDLDFPFDTPEGDDDDVGDLSDEPLEEYDPDDDEGEDAPEGLSIDDLAQD